MPNFLISQILVAQATLLEIGRPPAEVAAALRRLATTVMAPPPNATRALEAKCYEDATIEAAEICGPNSHEYDSLVESISERLFNERHPA